MQAFAPVLTAGQTARKFQTGGGVRFGKRRGVHDRRGVFLDKRGEAVWQQQERPPEAQRLAQRTGDNMGGTAATGETASAASPGPQRVGLVNQQKGPEFPADSP